MFTEILFWQLLTCWRSYICECNADFLLLRMREKSISQSARSLNPIMHWALHVPLSQITARQMPDNCWAVSRRSGRAIGSAEDPTSDDVLRSECISWSRVGIRDCCARNMPKHTTQYTEPHHMHSCIVWLLREGTKKLQAYVLTLKSSNQVIKYKHTCFPKSAKCVQLVQPK
jgi:hypothetical protein